MSAELFQIEFIYKNHMAVAHFEDAKTAQFAIGLEFHECAIRDAEVYAIVTVFDENSNVLRKATILEGGKVEDETFYNL